MMIQPISISSIIVTLLLLAGIESSCAFAPARTVSLSSATTTAPCDKFPTKTALHLSSPNQYDVSKPVFDLLCFRSVRGDALIRYNSLNQSEPLRINLFALLTLTLFAAPTLSEAVGNEEMGTVGTIASVLAGISSFGLFFRETRKRNRQLVRIEKELNTGNLQLRLPMNALSDQRFTKPATLTQLKTLSNPPRIISICGSKEELREALKGLSILGKRLRQATAFVVVIPTDGSKRSDWNLPADYPGWLAEAHDLSSWQTYFDELSPEDSSSQFRWFGLNSGGRSFGSGAGESPEWLQVLGQHLRPTDILDENDGGIEGANVESVVKAQQNFYQALTQGNLEEMNGICSTEEAAPVSEVIEAGGRIDDWKACLEDGARPEGMVVSGSDVFIVSDTEAYSTVVEFPANTGVDTATLLAVQRWGRSSVSEDWQLQLHETIPWSPEAKAQGTLRCDCRGCVALTRSAERRTFGGLIG